MTMRTMLLSVVCILFSVTLAAADTDDVQCKEVYEYDASIVGTVSSPSYGKQPYPDDVTCEYKIKAPQGYRIRLTFLDFDIDPSDTLFIFGKDKLSVLGVINGYAIPRPLLSHQGDNEVILLFESDFMVSGRGFKVQYESSPFFKSICEDGKVECINRNCFAKSQRCDGVDDCGDGTDEENCGRPVITEPKECGIQAIKPHTVYDGSDRMVGGESATPNSWPWQVSLQDTMTEPNSHFCGGVLINEQWVVTAAHCVQDFSKKGEIKIHLGAHGKYNTTQYELIRYSDRVISYPDLELDKVKMYEMKHDISLIKLNAPVKFNKGVQPACIPQLGWKPQDGATCIATGWGETRGTGSTDFLKQMEQIVQPKSKCSVDEHTQICVEKRNNSPCHGDSGGPLQCKVGDKFYVFGLSSFVKTGNLMGGLCTGPGSMAVFSSVADKAEWIKLIVNKYS